MVSSVVSCHFGVRKLPNKLVCRKCVDEKFFQDLIQRLCVALIILSFKLRYMSRECDRDGFEFDRTAKLRIKRHLRSSGVYPYVFSVNPFFKTYFKKHYKNHLL